MAFGWLALEVVEVWAYWGLAAFLGYNLWQNLLAFKTMGLWVSTLWTGMIFVLAYDVFQPKMAWRVSAGIYVTYLLVGLYFFSVSNMPWILFTLMYLSFGSYLLITRRVLWFRENAALLQREADRLFQIANTDALTGVANRRYMMEAIKKEMERAQQLILPLSLILLDLDRFKTINDDFGHEMGDRVLVHTAQILHQHMRKTDLVGRWGGEEFVILLPNTPASEAKNLAERLLDILSGNSLQNLRTVTASFGIASLTSEDTADTLLSRADKAMYDCKQIGGNRVKVSTRG